MKFLGFAASLGILLGIFTGRLILALLPTLPLSNDHPLFTSFGLRRPVVLGFLPFWLVDRAKQSYAEELTTLAYFALSINPDGSIQKLVTPQEQEPGWTTFGSPSIKNRLPTTLVIHNTNEDELLELLQDPISHTDKLISEILPILDKYSITHLNLDFESFSEVSDKQRAALTTLVERVVTGLKSRRELTVSFDLVTYHLIKQRLTDPIAIGKLVDYVVLMGYDFHYNQSYLAGPVSPVHGSGTLWDYDVDTAITFATQQIPRAKILLGSALYGYEWQTLSNIPGSPVIPNTAAIASNSRVESLLANCVGCTATFDDVAREPYLIFPKKQIYHQIFYTNESSLEQKLQLARTYKLAGVALWALGYEGKTMLNPLKAFKQQAQWLY